MSDIYFLWELGQSLIKIGFSRNVTKRVQALNQTQPKRILIATIKGDRWTERNIHTKFAYLRSQGEWFYLEEGLLEFIFKKGTLVYKEETLKRLYLRERQFRRYLLQVTEPIHPWVAHNNEVRGGYYKGILEESLEEWNCDVKEFLEADREIQPIREEEIKYHSQALTDIVHRLKKEPLEIPTYENIGLRRSNADKKKAVTKALTDERWGSLSNGAIARMCAVSIPFVSNLREKLSQIPEKKQEEPAKPKTAVAALILYFQRIVAAQEELNKFTDMETLLISVEDRKACWPIFEDGFKMQCCIHRIIGRPLKIDKEHEKFLRPTRS